MVPLTAVSIIAILPGSNANTEVFSGRQFVKFTSASELTNSSAFREFKQNGGLRVHVCEQKANGSVRLDTAEPQVVAESIALFVTYYLTRFIDTQLTTAQHRATQVSRRTHWRDVLIDFSQL